MQRTCLTLCGMTQPTTAAPLIVDKNNVDKGLASRFLWIFPKPVFKKFASLEVSANEELKEASKNFTIHLEDVIIQILKGSKGTATEPNIYELEITDENRTYPTAYDLCQDILERECLDDPFICALFSKAKGQYLRLAFPLHALFQVRPLPPHLPNQIPETVQEASISMIGLCIEHTALLAGRDIKDGRITAPASTTTSSTTTAQSSDDRLQQMVLTYPGKYVSASKLNNVSKFRRDGGKQKVVMVFTALENKNLGAVHYSKNRLAFFIKKNSSILSDEEMPDFLTSLEQLGITLEAYNGAYNNDEHPLAVESMTHYQQSQGKDQPPTKRQKVVDSPSTSKEQ